jgi:hypothetical protein
VQLPVVAVLLRHQLSSFVEQLIRLLWVVLQATLFYRQLHLLLVETMVVVQETEHPQHRDTLSLLVAVERVLALQTLDVLVVMV